MWLGPLHSPEFCAAVVTSVNAESDHYKTYARIKGMVSVARDVSIFLFVWVIQLRSLIV